LRFGNVQISYDAEVAQTVKRVPSYGEEGVGQIVM